MGLSGTLAILYVFWIVLLGRFDYLHLSLGIIARAIAANAFHDLLPEGKKTEEAQTQIILFVQYLPDPCSRCACNLCGPPPKDVHAYTAHTMRFKK
jgi:multisubunit Na+/H+ antiporter MnhE subunit